MTTAMGLPSSWRSMMQNSRRRFGTLLSSFRVIWSRTDGKVLPLLDALFVSLLGREPGEGVCGSLVSIDLMLSGLGLTHGVMLIAVVASVNEPLCEANPSSSLEPSPSWMDISESRFDILLDILRRLGVDCRCSASLMDAKDLVRL